MAFPINFVAGAAVGAIVAYVLKDEATKSWLTGTTKTIKDKTGSIITSMKKKPNGEETATDQPQAEAASAAAS